MGVDMVGKAMARDRASSIYSTQIRRPYALKGHLHIHEARAKEPLEPTLGVGVSEYEVSYLGRVFGATPFSSRYRSAVPRPLARNRSRRGRGTTKRPSLVVVVRRPWIVSKRRDAALKRHVAPRTSQPTSGQARDLPLSHPLVALRPRGGAAGTLAGECRSGPV